VFWVDGAFIFMHQAVLDFLTLKIKMARFSETSETAHLNEAAADLRRSALFVALLAVTLHFYWF
jgi:hypothetical protein